MRCLIALLFGTWAIQLWGEKLVRGWDRVLIRVAVNNPNDAAGRHGWQLILVNAYVLTGIGLLLVLAAVAVVPYPRPSRTRETESAEHVPELGSLR